ncbi:MAG TPA: ABC-type transport auxiliary lipoprotein family protein [Alphaproteobacteria bacterium]|jgi:cholesterol transport system auxiliary component|nr:ABC-type transport auxiliary lipoprotein family protein [Alphaproteobacteria bacterium]
MTRPSSARAAAALLLSQALLAGCTGILPGTGDPLRLYTLTPKSTYEGDLPKVDWQLVVEMPVAPAGINTNRIALAHSPITLDYYAGATWTDSSPALAQTLLIESFENTGKIVAVGRESVGLRPDYVLKLELREFQAEYASSEAPPTVHIRMIAKLVRMPQREIVATHMAQRMLPAATNTLDSVVAAFDDALGPVLKEIVIWTLTSVPPERPES